MIKLLKTLQLILYIHLSFSFWIAKEENGTGLATAVKEEKFPKWKGTLNLGRKGSNDLYVYSVGQFHEQSIEITIDDVPVPVVLSEWTYTKPVLTGLVQTEVECTGEWLLADIPRTVHGGTTTFGFAHEGSYLVTVYGWAEESPIPVVVSAQIVAQGPLITHVNLYGGTVSVKGEWLTYTPVSIAANFKATHPGWVGFVQIVKSATGRYPREGDSQIVDETGHWYLDTLHGEIFYKKEHLNEGVTDTIEMLDAPGVKLLSPTKSGTWVRYAVKDDFLVFPAFQPDIDSPSCVSTFIVTDFDILKWGWNALALASAEGKWTLGSSHTYDEHTTRITPWDLPVYTGQTQDQRDANFWPIP